MKEKREPSLLQQWKNRKSSGEADRVLLRRPEGEHRRASFGQERLWALQQRFPENPFYQYGHLFCIDGTLRTDLLVQAIRQLVGRYEILLSTFDMDEDQLRVNLKNLNDFTVGQYEVSNLGSKDVRQWAVDYCRERFDLSKDYLFRACMITDHEEKHWLVISMHHIIGDRDSLQIIKNEIFDSYEEMLKGSSQTRPVPEYQYSDFSYWQRSKSLDPQHLKFWDDTLHGQLPVLDLPRNAKRTNSFMGEIVERTISSALTAQLISLARKNQTTPFALMLAIYQIALTRFTNQNELVIGSPVSTRDRAEWSKQIGFFNETVCLKQTLNPIHSFSEILAETTRTVRDAMAHQSIPFDEVVRMKQVDHRSSVNPIFQTMFLHDQQHDQRSGWSIDLTDEMLDLGVSKFDLTVFSRIEGERLRLVAEFANDIYEKSLIESILVAMECIAEEVVNDDQHAIGEIPILNDLQRDQIKEWGRGKHIDYSSTRFIHDLILTSCKDRPEMTAVTDQYTSITYEQLDRQSAILAQALIDQGVQPNDSVGLYFGREVQMIVGILGVLRAGACYVPLDPEYPAERIEFMVQDSGTQLIIYHSNSPQLTGPASITGIDIAQLRAAHSTEIVLSPEADIDRAYLIYTSGSSGKPKGVSISHRNLIHSTLARSAFYPEPPDAFLLLSSFSFDSSVAGIFWTLTTGGHLVISPKRLEQDVLMLSNLISTHQITHTLLLPSLYQLLIHHGDKTKLRSLRNVMVAGEACPPGLVAAHFDRLPQTELYNEYGPTEATVWCIAHQMTTRNIEVVPIGRPIANTTIHILNSMGQEVPIGVPGELYIEGNGVAREYLNRDDLTAERFVHLPHLSQRKLYRTGDLVRFDDNGNIEFLGRVDQQIKIRGHRVELEEIERQIQRIPGVEMVIVDAIKNEQGPTSVVSRLVAYLVANGELSDTEIRNVLTARMPDYMIPALFIQIDKFERLPNGKIDRSALPNPDLVDQEERAYRPPENELQKQLVKVWQEVLGVQNIGIEDNFFQIGGDSIRSIQVVSKARDLNLVLKPNQLFEHQTIKALSLSIHEMDDSQEDAIIHSSDVDHFPLTDLQRGFLFHADLTQHDPGILELAFNLRGRIDVRLFEKALDLVSMRHTSMRLLVEKNQTGEEVLRIRDEKLHSIRFFDCRENAETDLAPIRPDLIHGPTNDFRLFHLDEGQYRLEWSCHHLFLDGWSCGIIVQDIISTYELLSKDEQPEQKKRPQYFDFAQWQENQPIESQQEFWRNQLTSFSTPLRFQKQDQESMPGFADISFALSSEKSSRLKEIARVHGGTTSVLIQTIWAVILSRLFGSRDVVFGLTTSGRFHSFPDIDQVTGLLMNVLPRRMLLDEDLQLASWLIKCQQEQGTLMSQDRLSINEIMDAIDWPLNIPLFDTLFVYGNFLQEEYGSDQLKIIDFEGGFSTNVPLTIRVNPLDEIEIDLRYQSQVISSNLAKWVSQQFHQLVFFLTNENEDITLGDLIKQTKPWEYEMPLIDLRDDQVHDRKQPEGLQPTQEMLWNVWCDLFRTSEFGIDDDFFQLGGNSFMALRLFSAIEDHIQIALPPAMLFKHRTIRQLAISIDREDGIEQDLMIPLKTGEKPPLFCIHGGGAHVFFYQQFAERLPAGQPVYSIQPKGLDGSGEFHESIEEMATDYIDEIMRVQPHGPYHILGTCFSNAVALEMANQLLDRGEKVGLLAIIDSGPMHLFGDANAGEKRTIKRFLDMLSQGDFIRIKKKIVGRIKKTLGQGQLRTIKAEGKTGERLDEMIDSLNRLYAKYHWKSFAGKIHFFRSSEFHSRRDKKYHLNQWKKLAESGLIVEVVDGHHVTLFEEPEVKGLADRVGIAIESQKQ